jgi:hypothetical protein
LTSEEITQIKKHGRKKKLRNIDKKERVYECDGGQRKPQKKHTHTHTHILTWNRIDTTLSYRGLKLLNTGLKVSTGALQSIAPRSCQACCTRLSAASRHRIHPLSLSHTHTHTRSQRFCAQTKHFGGFFYNMIFFFYNQSNAHKFFIFFQFHKSGNFYFIFIFLLLKSSFFIEKAKEKEKKHVFA